MYDTRHGDSLVEMNANWSLNKFLQSADEENWDFTVLESSVVADNVGWPNYRWMPGTDHHINIIVTLKGLSNEI
jgi:hypothetical protein